MRNLIVTMIFLLVFGGSFGLSYLCYTIERDRPCNGVIEFMDGTKVGVKKSHSNDNGTTNYRLCNDSRVIVPTVRIKSITRK